MVGRIPLDIGIKLLGAWIAMSTLATWGASGAAADELPKAPPHLSGQQYLDRQFDNTDTPREDRENKAIFNQQYARGYLAGVADLSRGDAWCSKTQPKPAELEVAVLRSLRKLSRLDLQQDASQLILQALRSEFPCT